MSSESRFVPDVVVIGAGPTGLTTALFLDLYGVRTLVVERGSTTSDEPRAVGLADESLRMFSQIGVLDDLAPEIVFDIGNRYFGVGDALLAEVKAAPSPQGFPAKSVFDQPILEQVLAAAAQTRPHIELRYDTTATVVSADPAIVELQGPTGTEQLRPQWVVGCDGGRSDTRKALGFELKGSTQKHRWVCYDVLEDPHSEEFAEMHCNGVRPLVVAPGANNRCRYEFMLLPGDDQDQLVTFEAARELLAPYRTLEPEQLRRARVYVAQERVAEHLASGRVVLAGDAYHLMPPFAGQGLNAGMRDAANAAWKIAAIVKGRAGASLIETYEQERRPHVVQMVKLSTRLGKVIMATGRRRTAWRDRAIRALRFIPPVNDYVTQMRFMRPAAFTRGCVVPGANDVPAGLREGIGRSLPQFKVAAAGDAVGIDAFLGADWALLTNAPAASAALTDEHVADVAELVGAQRIRVVDGVSQWSVAPAGWTALASDAVPEWSTAGGAPVFVLVRPDRYVAAAFTAQHAAEVLEHLSRWFVAPARRPAAEEMENDHA